MSKTPVDRSPYPMRRSLGALVHDVARLRRKRLDEALRPIGLTRAQRWMLIQLSQFGDDGISQVELAQAMQVGAVSLGEKLRLLETAGFVARVRSGTDRRQNVVRLTDAGYRALHQSTDVTQRFNRQLLAGLGDEELAAAEHVLTVLHAALSAKDRIASE